MKKITILLLFLFTFSISAQDVIVTSNNEEISAKVEEIHIETISYKKFNNLSGPSYHIEKSEVAKIIFENGDVETFDVVSEDNDEDEATMEETQTFLIEYIGKYCYDDNGYLKNRYKAKFEGDYLRLIVMNKDQSKELSNHLFNFKNVYSFRRPDRRADNLAYLNFYVPFLANEKKDKWDKLKLVMSVEGHENAQSIVNALKHYNYLLKQKTKKPGQKF
ncbi:hypothetical protein [Xanthomarina spongicola]|uniref:Uncharacterized protein n=1 Tax=Xanthomarina spongicola TaxID=570520 RepID=A0A316DSC9_9FLAO|nr:hypothetical protein [Xanthomarina spongicola]PWK20716.1 hypothetical protein LX78_00419 [Xanthomarina spongicola]